MESWIIDSGHKVSVSWSRRSHPPGIVYKVNLHQIAEAELVALTGELELTDDDITLSDALDEALLLLVRGANSADVKAGFCQRLKGLPVYPPLKDHIESLFADQDVESIIAQLVMDKERLFDAKILVTAFEPHANIDALSPEVCKRRFSVIKWLVGPAQLNESELLRSVASVSRETPNPRVATEAVEGGRCVGRRDTLMQSAKPKDPSAELHRNLRGFFSQLPELKELNGQFVAFKDGVMIASNPDGKSLIAEMKAAHPGEVVLVQQVQLSVISLIEAAWCAQEVH